jgi:probable F420-dependent oxidoreductase
MRICLGYLLPTRERVMAGEHETGSLLGLAERAESIGFDSVWVGDSLVAKPRHEPLTLLAAVAARTRQVDVGTAVLLPALRNPVVLAHLVATVDRISEGRLILGVGIGADAPSIRAEFTAAGVPFEKRVGRMMEGLRLCRALWSGEPVTWSGRWHLEGQVLGPTPHRAGGPPIWIGSRVRAGMERTGRYFDGWFPTGPDAEGFRDQVAQVREVAQAAGRDPAAVAAAIYVTLRIDDDRSAAQRHIDQYLESYYGVQAPSMKRSQACFAGSEPDAVDWLRGFVQAGAEHLVIRLAGDPERQLDAVARMREALQA